MSHSAFQRYTFVDYSSQAYSALVGLAIVLFHNGTVPHWPWLVVAHGLGILTIHWLIRSSDVLCSKPQINPPEQRSLSAAFCFPDKLRGKSPLSGSRSSEPKQCERRQAGPTEASLSSAGAAGAKGNFAALFRTLNFLRHFYPVLLYIWFYTETGWLNRMFFKTYLDPVVIRLDQALFGCQPSILWMQTLPYLGVSEILYAAYFSYYLMIFGVGLALFVRNRQQFFHYISLVSFVFYICYALYIAVPVIGPATLLHQVSGYTLPADLQALAPDARFPEAVRSGVFYRMMKWIYEVFEAPGAAIPSSHVAVAICIVFFSFRYLRPVRYGLLVLAVLLCLSTIYCRYHYASDVLAGIATAAMLVPLGNWLYFKLEKHELVGAGRPEGSGCKPNQRRPPKA